MKSSWQLLLKSGVNSILKKYPWTCSRGWTCRPFTKILSKACCREAKKVLPAWNRLLKKKAADRLKREIAALEAKIHREPQFNRKVEYNLKLQEKRKELEKVYE
ncbi:MAG: DUF4391 family protein [Peptococcaceae bacterium]|nr:MAG: DUF4391 family protein [Peptococcaceae bacterium]